MNVKNIWNGVSDFIPSKLGLVKDDIKPREPPPPMWFVAELNDSDNRYVTICNLQRKVGGLLKEMLSPMAKIFLRLVIVVRL